MSYLTSAYVYGGVTGSTIDNGGFNITIGQNLLALATGSGVNPVTDVQRRQWICRFATRGDHGRRQRQRRDGNGRRVNPSTGKVTGITITSPERWLYTSAPDFHLSWAAARQRAVLAAPSPPP